MITMVSSRLKLSDTIQDDRKLLESCYYNVSEPQIILEEYIGSSMYYVLLGQRQTEVGILDITLTKFAPADPDFQREWSKERKFNEIYSSNYIDLFMTVNI